MVLLAAATLTLGPCTTRGEAQVQPPTCAEPQTTAPSGVGSQQEPMYHMWFGAGVSDTATMMLSEDERLMLAGVAAERAAAGPARSSNGCGCLSLSVVERLAAAWMSGLGNQGRLAGLRSVASVGCRACLCFAHRLRCAQEVRSGSGA